jgi:hypothetical protein
MKNFRTHTPNEIRTILAERIHRLETGEEKLIPNEVVFVRIRKKYGF